MVTDALSRKLVHISTLMVRELGLVKSFRDLELQVELEPDETRCNKWVVFSSLLEKIKEGQLLDPELQTSTTLIGTEKGKDFNIGTNSLLRFKGRTCVPNDGELKRLILEEGHRIRFSIHSSMTKMYQDLKKSFW